jgi:arylsulfatase A-like enzyme
MSRAWSVLTLAACAAAPTEDRAPVRPPNVVLVVVDDLGATDAGCCGSDWYRTPNLDRLAREGMRFTQAYAACAVCSPTRAALLTGRYPARIGVTDWIHHDSELARAAVARGAHRDGFETIPGRPLRTPNNRTWLPLGEVTIAELLHPRGHASCHVGKWHLGPRGFLPQDQGFDENHGGSEIGQPPGWFDPFEGRIAGLPARSPGQYLTDREADEAVSFVERHADRPFFLQLAHYAVHSPLEAPKGLVSEWATRPRGAHHTVPVYAAMVERVDAALGRVLDALDRHGLAERTLVVFTSDNGGAVHFPATSNAPLRAGKGYPYEGGLRVPLVVRWPGRVAPGTTCDVPVSSIDLLPTVAEAVGATLPEDVPIDGVSLVPLLEQRRALPPRSLCWHFPHYWWGTRIQPYSIVRRGEHKLIHHWEGDHLELFDLDADPGEQRDLADERPELARELDAELLAALDRQGACLPRRDGR